MERTFKTLQKPQFVGPDGKRLKLIIFTEYRDTLDYLERKIKTCWGSRGRPRDSWGIKLTERNEIQENFRNDPDVSILIATDAAGKESISTGPPDDQLRYPVEPEPARTAVRPHPPDRADRTRFMWNMVAERTREGEVFRRLFLKLEAARKVGRACFRYPERFSTRETQPTADSGDHAKESPEDQNKINKEIDGTLDPAHLNRVIRENALVQQAFTPRHSIRSKPKWIKPRPANFSPVTSEIFYRSVSTLWRRDSPAGRRTVRTSFYPSGHTKQPKDVKKIGGAIAKSMTESVSRKKRFGGQIRKTGRVSPSGAPAGPFPYRPDPGKPLGLLKPGTVMFDPSDDGRNLP